MHLNYFFLKKVAEELDTILRAAKIVEAFSQNKNELILVLLPKNESEYFHIQINLSPNFTYINFPATYHRSKRNSISLLESCYGEYIAKVKIIPNDRVIAVELSNQFILVLKFHGNQSNVILLQENKPIELFRRRLKKDLKLDIDNLKREIDLSKEGFISSNGNLEHYPTLGPFSKRYLNEQWSSIQNLSERWEVFKNLLNQLEDPEVFIVRDSGKVTLSLFKYKEVLSTYRSPIQALKEFTSIYARENDFENRFKEAETILQREEKKAIQSLQALESATEKLENQKNYQLYGDLIMTNLQKINPYEDVVVLEDYASGNKLRIPLKKGLTPQKNAENYYRKSKNQHLQISKNKDLIEKKREMVQEIASSKELLREAETTKEIENLIAPFKKLKLEKSVSLPYNSYEFMGFEIRVGRNAKSNDLTSFKYSYKDDLWLHVKDASGSHVIIKSKAGNPFPKPVIEKAAKLAAYNSKRKTEGLVPVTYTLKKFVRKRKGDPPGAVVVEKEKVILVEPES